MRLVTQNASSLNGECLKFTKIKYVNKRFHLHWSILIGSIAVENNFYWWVKLKAMITFFTFDFNSNTIKYTAASDRSLLFFWKQHFDRDYNKIIEHAHSR